MWSNGCASTLTDLARASVGITFATLSHDFYWEGTMIRKLRSGEYRLYSRKVDPKTGKRRNLGTFGTRAAAQKHERAVQFFKRRG